MWPRLLDEEAKAKKGASCINASQLRHARPHTGTGAGPLTGLFYKDKETQEGRDKHVGGARGLCDPGSEVPRCGLWLTGNPPRDTHCHRS